MDNKEANLHILSFTDTMFFTHSLDAIRERINKICAEAKLDGNWTLSEDYKFLVKIGD